MKTATLSQFKTSVSLSDGTRQEVIDYLNQRLADTLDLKLQTKHAHWNIKGIEFIQLHELFDEIAAHIEDQSDLIAERIVQLGGIAEGTVRVAGERSRLEEYPLDIAEGHAHVEAVSKALSTFGHEARKTIDQADELEDADTADIFTEISRGIDKWLWFVEAHSQAPK